MDPNIEAMKMLLATFGGSGLVAFFSYLFFGSWKATLKEKDAINEKRIAALEDEIKICRQDRRELHARFDDFQKNTFTHIGTVLQGILKKLE